MTQWIKKLMTTVAFGLVLATPTLAADRGDCKGTMTEIVTTLQKADPSSTATELPEASVKTILSKLGPPPVEAPYTFAKVSANGVSAVVIHDEDCVLMTTSPVPTQVLDHFFNETEG